MEKSNYTGPYKSTVRSALNGVSDLKWSPNVPKSFNCLFLGAFPRDHYCSTSSPQGTGSDNESEEPSSNIDHISHAKCFGETLPLLEETAGTKPSK
jgi:hypothetical protein